MSEGVNEHSDRCLVVVGAAAGMGRWLVDHLLAPCPWRHVVLVDTEPNRSTLDAAASQFSASVGCGVVAGEATLRVDGLGPADLAAMSGSATTVVVAVPTRVAGPVVGVLAPMVAPDATFVVVSAAQRAALSAVGEHAGGRRTVGLHPLFDSSARGLDGQTVALVAEDTAVVASLDRLVELIVGAGGIVERLTVDEHDRTMTYVQTVAHESLLAFAHAVTSSEVDLEQLWELRTPLFESLFGLATRVIAERQQASIADIQVAGGGSRAVAALRSALDELDGAVASGLPHEVERFIDATRMRFSGSLFETVQATATSAVTAAQSKRAQMAEVRRLGELVGLHPVARPDALRVGRIVDVTSTAVTLHEVMVGRRGQATLLEGPGRRNAARVGVGGKPQRTVFGLGHVELVAGRELEVALDDWLAQIKRDVRFLVPESVAGAGILRVISNHSGVRRAELVSEVVRTGQRAVVIRVWIRADRDVDDMVEELRSRVQAAYAWPAGISLPATGVRRVHFLGPTGTFSEAAARHASASAGLADAELVPQADFDAVLAAIDERSIGILPISSSASGLVGRSAHALLRSDAPLTVGGVVDVPVRFDAYIRAEAQLADLRGARVYSHPQALGQCTSFIRRWELEPVACSSTTDALHVVAESDEGAVALAAADAPIDAALKVAERELDDLAGSITRFLLLGTGEVFGRLVGGSDPTLRSIWVADSLASLLAVLTEGESAYDELLSSEAGPSLLVTSRTAEVAADPSRLRWLGRAPWSPRTPVVRVEVSVQA